jgi:hypothetical protein
LADASNAAAPSELRSNDRESFIVKKRSILPAVIGKQLSRMPGATATRVVFDSLESALCRARGCRSEE